MPTFEQFEAAFRAVDALSPKGAAAAADPWEVAAYLALRYLIHSFENGSGFWSRKECLTNAKAQVDTALAALTD